MIDLSFNSLTHIDLGDTTPTHLFVIHHNHIHITLIDYGFETQLSDEIDSQGQDTPRQGHHNEHVCFHIHHYCFCL